MTLSTVTPTHVRALRNAPVRANWTSVRTKMAIALERAGVRALDRTAHAFNETSYNKQQVLAVLADAIVCRVFDDAGDDVRLYAWTPEAPSLLSALRHELLCGSSRREWSSADLLPAITAIEQLSAVLALDTCVQFTQQFSGREAQQRLVETAHDMRSPLNAILLLVERMQRGQDGAVNHAQQQHLELVYSAAFELTTLANDLMDVARGGARLLAQQPTAFSLAEVLRSVRDVVQPIAAARRLSVRFSSPPADRRIGQEAALHRVLLNLTTNALKYTTVGSVTVEVRQLDDPDELQFSIEDTGRGIPQPALDDIFSNGVGLRKDRPQSFTPDGLGLAICRRLVTAMRGELQVESRVDHGTRFSFVLRLHSAPPP